MDLCALVPHRAAPLSASSCGASTQQELARALCAYAQALSHKSNRIAIVVQFELGSVVYTVLNPGEGLGTDDF